MENYEKIIDKSILEDLQWATKEYLIAKYWEEIAKQILKLLTK